MKKVLLAIVLALSLLLTLASCDGITSALGSVFGGDKVEDSVSKPSDKDEESDIEEIDDAAANISGIASAVNKGMELGSLIETDAAESINYEEAVEQLRQAIKDVAFSKDLTVTADSNGEKASIYGYVGMRDGVMYASMTGSSDIYMFVEDDFKIVTVEVDEDGSCYADAGGGLYEYIESLINMGEAEPNEETQMMMQFVEKIMEIQLPQISEKDISYNEEDGRYYLSDKYTEKAIHEISRKILEDYYEVYPEETPEDIYEGLEEGIAEAIQILNLKIWMNARSENVTGFGFSVDVAGENFDEADDIGRVTGTFDLVSNCATLNVVVEGTEDYEANCTVNATVSYTKNSFQASGALKLESEDMTAEMKGSCKVSQSGAEAELYMKTTGEDASDNVELDLKASISTDKEGMLQSASLKCDYTGAYNNGIYDYDDYGNACYITLEGTQTASIDFSLDMANIEKGGTVATLAMQMTASDFEAYVEKYDEYGYYDGEEYSEEYSRKYAGMTEEMCVGFEVISSNGGDKITAKVETRQNSISQEEDTTVSIAVILEPSSNADFSISADVEEARQEALDSYGMEYETEPGVEDEYYN